VAAAAAAVAYPAAQDDHFMAVCRDNANPGDIIKGLHLLEKKY